jgi:hypothetical protein
LSSGSLKFPLCILRCTPTSNFGVQCTTGPATFQPISAVAASNFGTSECPRQLTRCHPPATSQCVHRRNHGYTMFDCPNPNCSKRKVFKSLKQLQHNLGAQQACKDVLASQIRNMDPLKKAAAVATMPCQPATLGHTLVHPQTDPLEDNTGFPKPSPGLISTHSGTFTTES